MRFAWWYPYFAFEDYISNLNPALVTSTFLAFGTGGLPISGRVGTLQTYHIGMRFLLAPPPGNAFNINLDFAIQNKTNAGVAIPPSTEALNDNQWVGHRRQFQWKEI